MKEKIRQQIEKILWKAYEPDMSPNMEEISEEIVAVFTKALLKEIGEFYYAKDTFEDTFESGVVEERQRIREIITNK